LTCISREIGGPLLGRGSCHIPRRPCSLGSLRGVKRPPRIISIPLYYYTHKICFSGLGNVEGKRSRCPARIITASQRSLDSCHYIASGNIWIIDLQKDVLALGTGCPELLFNTLQGANNILEFEKNAVHQSVRTGGIPPVGICRFWQQINIRRAKLCGIGDFTLRVV